MKKVCVLLKYIEGSYWDSFGCDDRNEVSEVYLAPADFDFKKKVDELMRSYNETYIGSVQDRKKELNKEVRKHFGLGRGRTAKTKIDEYIKLKGLDRFDYEFYSIFDYVKVQLDKIGLETITWESAEV